MENGRFFSNERGLASGKNSHFNSIGGNLARVSDYNSTEVSIAKTQDDLVRSTYKKKEFLPFLNERDGLNRLIAVPSKYDPTKLEESGNPAFYYKSQRFNKYLLRLEHAENNKHALGKMLDHHSRTPSETKNFLEADKVIRLKKLMTKKSINFDEWKRSGVETKANFDEGTTIQRGLNTLDSLDSAILPRTILAEDSSTNYFFKNLQEIRMNQKKKSEATSQFAGNRKASQNIKAIKLKSQAKLARNLFLPSDDYINFYKKLDSDIRDIAISSIEVRRTAKDNVAHLNSVAKKRK